MFALKSALNGEKELEGINVKKTFVFILSLTILIRSAAMIYAAAPAETTAIQNQELTQMETEAAQQAKVAAAEPYAYMDLETVPAEMQQTILDARNTIIFSRSWGVEGGRIIRANGTIEPVPAFYEIFPEDWDIPSFDINPEMSDSSVSDSIFTGGNASVQSSTEGWLYSNLYFQAPPSSGNTPAVGSFYHNGNWIKTEVRSLSSSQHCNVGVTNNSTGASVGYANYLTVGDIYQCYTSQYLSLYAGIRYSTYSTPGYGSLYVSHDSAGQAR